MARLEIVRGGRPPGEKILASGAPRREVRFFEPLSFVFNDMASAASRFNASFPIVIFKYTACNQYDSCIAAGRNSSFLSSFLESSFSFLYLQAGGRKITIFFPRAMAGFLFHLIFAHSPPGRAKEGQVPPQPQARTSLPPDPAVQHLPGAEAFTILCA